MSFQIPKELQDYLSLNWRKPPQNFVNTSQYYAGMSPYFMNYMNTVVRPCMAYARGAADGVVNSGLKLNIGYSIKRTAVNIIKGDKVIFEGEDADCKILSDKWSPSVGFDMFLESAIDYMLAGGTAIIKLNKDRRKRCIPTANIIDRFYATYDETGEIMHVIFLNSFLYTEKFSESVSNSYWLVEERYYNRNGMPVVRYKVNIKSGTAGQEVLPNLYDSGIPFEKLPETVKKLVNAKGARLNKEILLPFRDGLGCWTLRRTATNSCVPGLPMGDPLLYGALDLLWSADVVFGGSLTDVILGEGKILVPKRYLNAIRQDFADMKMQTQIGDQSLSDRILARSDMANDDDSFTYVATERDKDFPPQNIQFDIRSEQYRGMLELYLRQIATHCGFAPSSLFPFLADGSVRTATEVTAEENLTRGTVESIHRIITPVLDRLVNEVLFQAYKDTGIEYKGHVTIKLSDYIGNPILRDQNIRENYAAGLVPEEVAVQRVNGISSEETQEYIEKINEKRRSENFGNYDLDDLYKGAMNDNSEQTAEQSGDSPGRSGSGDPRDGETGVLPSNA